jgi:hypothetical protein
MSTATDLIENLLKLGATLHDHFRNDDIKLGQRFAFLEWASESLLPALIKVSAAVIAVL